MRLIVCPVLAGHDMTRRAIRSALAQDIDDVHILAIDNGSTDGTGTYLRSLPIKDVTLITYNPTVSLHHVWNQALTLAFSRADAPVLVINNDVILRPDTVRLLEADGGQFVTGVGVGTMAQLDPVDVTSHSPHPSFSCFMIRRECWERVGQFDENMWAWCGDLDYHLRMHVADINACAISLPFYHEGSATIRTVPRDLHERLCKLSDADRTYFANKWGCAAGSKEYSDRFRALPREQQLQTHGRPD